jgi:hypothetical protein
MNTRRNPSHTFLATIFLISAAFLPAAIQAQMDMNIMMQWADTTVIRWKIIGDYERDDLILNVGTNGYAPVKDHVEITFEYTNEGNGGLVGTPTIVDSPTQIGELRNGAEGCRAPTISGHYERATIELIEDGLGGQLAMTVRTDYPAGLVPVACTGGNQPSPERSSINHEDLIVPGIMMLAMGDEIATPELRVAPDRKSFIVKRGGWSYVYTPTKVK